MSQPVANGSLQKGIGFLSPSLDDVKSLSKDFGKSNFNFGRARRLDGSQFASRFAARASPW